MNSLGDLTTALRDLQLPELSKREAFDAMQALLTLRNLIDHHAATLAATLDRLGVAAEQGRKTRELLLCMGCAPAVASRLLRVGAAADSLPTLAAHAADGAVSSEHAYAIVAGVEHIARRAPDPLSAGERYAHVTELLGQFFSGATPAHINAHARQIGNQIAADTGGLPAADDRSINTLDHHRDDDGRLHLRADLDVHVGEKFVAAIEDLSAPRPEPDGAPDHRTAARRRADALETVLDLAARGAGGTTSAPRTQVLVTVPADTRNTAELAFGGPVTDTTLDIITCDAEVTTVIVDSQRVPLDMSTGTRLFPPHLRKALYVRDHGCIKCGAPASRTHAHHIHHWAHGGQTTLNNGCLLCPACHTDVHHHGWDITIGLDKHPWLIPPATVDPHRTPQPAYHRRTMHLDNAAVA